MVDIDYQVGDLVESCHFLPGIVQKIDIDKDEVLIFSFDHIISHPGEYCGGSSCSIKNCGVHKISQDYAMKLLSLGEKRLAELWKDESHPEMTWEEQVEVEFNKVYEKDLDLWAQQNQT